MVDIYELVSMILLHTYDHTHCTQTGGDTGRGHTTSLWSCPSGWWYRITILIYHHIRILRWVKVCSARWRWSCSYPRTWPWFICWGRWRRWWHDISYWTRHCSKSLCRRYDAILVCIQCCISTSQYCWNCRLYCWL